MFTIGILNISGKLSQEYITELQGEGYHVIFVDPAQYLNDVCQKVDGLILFDEHQESVGAVCNMILTIKKESPVLMWTVSRGVSPVNRLVYLRLGVLGNIELQCEPEELCLIIQNSLNSRLHSTLVDKRAVEVHSAASEQETQKLSLNSVNQSVWLGDKEVSLTRLEFQILNLLYQNSGQAITYQEIHATIWEDKDEQTFSKSRIANIILLLRRKIESDIKEQKYIRTVRSKGYMLVQ